MDNLDTSKKLVLTQRTFSISIGLNWPGLNKSQKISKNFKKFWQIMNIFTVSIYLDENLDTA